MLSLLAAAVFLALSGPFGTYVDFGLFERFQFWVASIAAAGLFIHTVVHFALMISSSSRRLTVIAILVGTALGSVPATAAIMEIYSYLSETRVGVDRFPFMWSNVTLIGIIISMTQFWPHIMAAGPKQSETPNESAEPMEEPTPDIRFNVPILARLPNCVEPNKIVSFSMQDHYVELMTVKGPHLLLMRFADALDLLGDMQGLRIHRSHWVSHIHLNGLEKEGRKMLAVLSDGRKLPVSATYLDQVRTHLKEKSAT